MTISVRRRALVASAISSALSGCWRTPPQAHEVNKGAIKRVVTIQVGQSGAAFIRANSLQRIDVRREPAGIDFYSIDWPTKLPGIVRVDHKSFSFKIEGALGVLGTENTESPTEGLLNFHIGAGITIDDTISHAEARDHIMATLQMLLAVGWRRTISRGRPRLRGSAAVTFSVERLGVYSLDPAYTPSMSEWMQLSSYSQWDLCAEGVYLTLRFMRDSERVDVIAPGAYFISWELRSEADEIRKYFTSEERLRWKELWPERAKAAQKDREEAEAKMRAQGWTIDTNYTDPPILGLNRS